MIYSELLTKKELVISAMPLVNLTLTQWGVFLEHCEQIKKKEGSESELFKTLETLLTNQSRIEVMTMITANCYEEFNDPVSDKVTEQLVVGL